MLCRAVPAPRRSDCWAAEQVGLRPRWAQALDCAGFCYQSPFVGPQNQRHEPTWPAGGREVPVETGTRHEFCGMAFTVARVLDELT